MFDGLDHFWLSLRWLHLLSDCQHIPQSWLVLLACCWIIPAIARDDKPLLFVNTAVLATALVGLMP